MGILDDAATIISARTSHSKRSKSHRSSRHSHSRRDRSRSKSRSRSRSRHRSSRSAAGGMAGGITGIAASLFGGGDDDDDEAMAYGHADRSSRRRSSQHHHHKERDRDDDGTRSFFSLPNPSRSSFFSNFGRRASHSYNPFASSSSSSYYRRSPRPAFVSRLLKKLRRLLRDLLYYARRHPLRVAMLVLMPLVTGGALTALLARVGLRLPPSLERLLGAAARAGTTGDSLGLVGEAVRMVSGGGGSAGSRVARASVERGRDGGVRWERRSVEKDYYGGGGGAGFADGFRGVAKMFS